MQPSKNLDLASVARVLVSGDLIVLSEEQRGKYYADVCESLGLNPLTQPFAFLNFNGKLLLYAKKDATDQLRRLLGISVENLQHSFGNDLYIVTVTGSDTTGRKDTATAAMSLLYPDKIHNPDGSSHAHPRAGTPLKGQELAAAIMTAETKAKRRLTLSISGLGFLDESEVETLHGAVTVEPTPAAPPAAHAAPPVDHTPAVPTEAPRPGEARPSGPTPAPEARQGSATPATQARQSSPKTPPPPTDRDEALAETLARQRVPLTTEERKFVGQKIREYGVDVDLLGKLVLQITQAPNSKDLSMVQWKSVFEILDRHRAEGALADVVKSL